MKLIALYSNLNGGGGETEYIYSMRGNLAFLVSNI